MSPGRERLCPLSAGCVWDRVVAMRVFSDIPFLGLCGQQDVGFRDQVFCQLFLRKTPGSQSG